MRICADAASFPDVGFKSETAAPSSAFTLAAKRQLQDYGSR
ncbi:hypothetical protein PAMC26510_24275 [Caballeronia sordidicola]|uniref:Uncharacterized protein n=1 Tax=Caballeronia sordidicola TaxID=196367 RepID=A0A242MIB8_CABSO|nr:hypothetical protein PAMC26510_24275 [Caballeronia sordidicola]